MSSQCRSLKPPTANPSIIVCCAWVILMYIPAGYIARIRHCKGSFTAFAHSPSPLCLTYRQDSSAHWQAALPRFTLHYLFFSGSSLCTALQAFPLSAPRLISALRSPTFAFPWLACTLSSYTCCLLPMPARLGMPRQFTTFLPSSDHDFPPTRSLS